MLAEAFGYPFLFRTTSVYDALSHIQIAESYPYSEREFDSDSHTVEWKNEGGHICFYIEGYSKPPKSYHYKFAILSLIQGIELLLKSFVSTHRHESLFKGKERKTINLHEALKISLSIQPGIFSEDQRMLIVRAVDIRNEMQHYQFSHTLNEVREISRELFIVILKFAKDSHGIDVAKHFEFDQWTDREDPVYKVIVNLKMNLYKNA